MPPNKQQQQQQEEEEEEEVANNSENDVEHKGVLCVVTLLMFMWCRGVSPM